MPKRFTRGQRKAHAAAVSAKLKAEAEKWMRSRQMTFDDAFLAVLRDPEASKRCHTIEGEFAGLPNDWKVE